MSSGSDSFYRPPASDVERPIERGADFGSLAQAIRGDFELDIGEVMSEAWSLNVGSKGVILLGIVMVNIVSLALGVAGGIAEGAETVDGEGIDFATLTLQIIAGAVLAPISAGIYLFVIKRAAHDPSAGVGDLFECYPRLLPIVGLSYLQSLLILVGFLLLLLPGIYLAVAYGLALGVFVDKRLGVWSSLEASRKALGHVWLRVFGLALVVFLAVAFGSALTLGIGAIWLVPWSFLCIGVAYRKIFGYGPEPA